jgi:DUF438 domain-containing protein
MSEFLNNSSQRKEMLKHLLLRLHEGEAPDVLRARLIEVLKGIPYNEVVEVEQELISTGVLSDKEVLEFCDLHSAVLDGSIDLEGAKPIPPGHPVDTFKKENQALKAEVQKARDLFNQEVSDAQLPGYILQLRMLFNNLWDVDKHYKRKEYLLFPYLEKHQVTGPPKVMWGKDDEIRELLKAAAESLASPVSSQEEMKSVVELVLAPAVEMLDSMIMKEEEILLPMSMDTLTEEEWYKIYQETPEFGFSLIDPEDEWKPAVKENGAENVQYIKSDAIQLSSGAFNLDELEALFLHLPIDITFVDKNDKVRFFSHSANRVFERNRSIIGRDVRMCHPPGSVHIVEKIINDFKNGKENKAVFWLSRFMGSRFIYIEYSAVRSKDGKYLGVVEVTQDITALRKLEGDQRLLSYEQK